MKTNLLFLLFVLPVAGFAQLNPVNYDEAKIPPHKIPDAFTTLNG